MAHNFGSEREEHRLRRSGDSSTHEGDAAEHAEAKMPHLQSLLRGPALNARGNSQVRASAMQKSGQVHGNRAVQRLVGQRPQGGVADWYDFSTENKQGGYTWGGGYGTGAADSGEWWQRLGGDLPFTSGSILAWGENDDKDTRYGAKGEAGLGKLEYKGDGWSADASAFGINGEASAGSNGATFGGGATIVGGSATVGGFNPNSNTDTSTRFGLSAGPSFGLRTHWGDSDSDGHREMGLGFDLGIFSADIKTEDPLRSGINMMPGSNAQGLMAAANDSLGINKMLGGNYLPSGQNPSNWTEDMLGWASGTGKPTTIDNAFNDSWAKMGKWWDS
jgi:hypothetical protein